MKKNIFFFVLLTCIFSICKTIFSTVHILLKPSWQSITTTPDSQWIHVGSINIEKKNAQLWYLNTLVMHWHGPFITHLFGSLYEQNSTHQKFLPIDENFLCDSQWHQEEQKLIFRFKKPFPLISQAQLHVMLTVKPEYEFQLKQGNFHLDVQSLPLDLQKHLQPSTLIFTHNFR